jgi:hypothetical protein
LLSGRGSLIVLSHLFILFAPDGTILLRGNRMDAIEQKLAEIFSE